MRAPAGTCRPPCGRPHGRGDDLPRFERQAEASKLLGDDALETGGVVGGVFHLHSRTLRRPDGIGGVFHRVLAPVDDAVQIEQRQPVRLRYGTVGGFEHGVHARHSSCASAAGSAASKASASSVCASSASAGSASSASSAASPVSSAFWSAGSVKDSAPSSVSLAVSSSSSASRAVKGRLVFGIGVLAGFGIG